MKNISGQGIGRQLLDFMKKMAKGKHYDGLELSVNVHNQKANQCMKIMDLKKNQSYEFKVIMFMKGDCDA